MTGITKYHVSVNLNGGDVVLQEKCEEEGCISNHIFVMSDWQMQKLLREQEVLDLEPGRLYQIRCEL